MMMFGVAIKRAHHAVDASGVLANYLHPARAGEMPSREFFTHRVEPDASNRSRPPAALEFRVERILLARERGRGGGGRALVGNWARRFAHRFPTAASASK